MSTPVIVDPRLRARRVAVRRAEGRRRLNRLVWLLVLAAVVMLAVLATRSPLLDVDRVTVDGAAHTDPADVVAASGIAVGAPMTGVDLGDARRAIAALPWVADVSVRRDWPGTISVRIAEREAVATVATERSGLAVLDGAGRVLAVNAVAPAELPRISADVAAVAAGDVLAELVPSLRVADAMTDDLRAWVDHLALTDEGMELALVGGGRALLAGADPAAELASLATILTRVDLTCVVEIDVRIDRVPALRRDGRCSESATAQEAA